MKRLGSYIGLVFVLATCLATGLATPAVLPLAGPPVEAARPTILTLSPLVPQSLGTRFIVEARLVNTEGTPQGNKVLLLYLNGELVRRSRTDDSGMAAINLGRNLPAGSHEVEVVFIGTRDYLESRASATLTVRPAVLEVETVPPLPGILISLAGRELLTDANGIARFELTELGNLPLEVLLDDEAPIDAETHATFLRWGDDVFQPSRTIQVNGDRRIQAGFALSHPIAQTFVGLDGAPVDEARISSLTLKISNGASRTFPDGQPRWLQANRVQRFKNGLEVAPLQYSVESVMIDGTNVVNRYQQRFFVEPNNTWEIQLLLYFARLRAKDAVFGFPLGTGITLEYPDGRTEAFAFGPNSETYVGPLARGLYRVQVTGASGMAPVTPIAVSKDQDVDLKVLSKLSISAGLAFGMMIAFGLLFFGRPQLLSLPKRAVLSLFRLLMAGRPGVPVDNRLNRGSLTDFD